MTALNRTMTNVIASDVAASSNFYKALLGMTEHFTSDWFIILTHPGVPGLEFGLLDASSDIVPDALNRAPGGTLLTFVVDDVDAVHKAAQEMGATIIEPPRDLFYGQRRMIVSDPDGTLIDVSSPTAPTPA